MTGCRAVNRTVDRFRVTDQIDRPVDTLAEFGSAGRSGQRSTVECGSPARPSTLHVLIQDRAIDETSMYGVDEPRCESVVDHFPTGRSAPHPEALVRT